MLKYLEPLDWLTTAADLPDSWLFWYDEAGNRYPTPQERVEQAEARSQRLADRLRELGIDPDEV